MAETHYPDHRKAEGNYSRRAARDAATRGDHEAAARLYRQAASQFRDASKSYKDLLLFSYANAAKADCQGAKKDSKYHQRLADNEAAAIQEASDSPPMHPSLAASMKRAYREAVVRRGEGATVQSADICRELGVQ